MINTFMNKIPLNSTKYEIHGKFEIEGLVEKTDIIGSFFGQTEGLIGEDLEFSNLQKIGKLGRIEITLNKKDNVSLGNFIIPTSLDKIQVTLLAAAIESIEKFGHCCGKISILKIDDKRKNKREDIITRAYQMLEELKEELPDSKEITEQLSDKIKFKSIKQFGSFFSTDSAIESEEMILVEGIADLKNLIKNDYYNVFAFNGSGNKKEILKYCKNKKIILFLDDDGPGRKHLEEIKNIIKIDYYVFAPQGKEVENLTGKEIKKCLKNRKITQNMKFVNFLSIFKKIYHKKEN